MQEAPGQPPIEAQFLEYRRTRDPALRAQLIETHLGLAEHLARRFERRRDRVEDLVQVASLALVKAVDRFDPERGVQFSTFAVPTILGELKRHFRDKGWAVRVPRRLQETHLNIGVAIADLTQELGRSPTVPEVAARIGVSVEDVLDGMDASRAYQSTSLDAPTNDGDSTGDALSAKLGTEDPAIAAVEDRTEVERLLQCLKPRERRIVSLRFFEARTQSEIAVELGISQMHVSRLLARALVQLREESERRDRR
jgi:RNA polymerase sigma-B factor